MTSTKMYCPTCQAEHSKTKCTKYRNQRLRNYRKSNNNAVTRKYEKTPKGFLMRTYRNMLSRVKGIQWKKAHLYKGLDILKKQQFYDWALADKEFNMLFKTWSENFFDRKITPSINRIDSSQGYILENMEWITHSENSRLGSEARHEISNLRRCTMSN